MNITIALTLFSSIAFISYGYQCLRSDFMKNEFIRFGLNHQWRYLTGWLEILGGLGLLTGFYFQPLMMISSGGLTLLMALGLSVRIKIRDQLLKLSPAFFLMLINLWIFLKSIGIEV